MADFITYQLVLATTPLARPWGESWNLISAVMRDIMISGAKDALKCRFIEYCPDDALVLHGLERVLPRAPGELADPYRLRLLAAWETWLLAGTAAGIEVALNVLGGDAHVTENQDWDPAPPDGDLDSWWRFWVSIADTGYETDGLWDDPGVWDDGGVWDTDTTLAQVTAVRSAVRTWMAAHAICVDIEILAPSIAPDTIHWLP